MAVSASGVCTLLFLIFIGPLIYGCNFLYVKFRANRDNAAATKPAEEDNDREELSSNQYLFALVGYAIGIGNIWRFPYVIANNGGSAALFAYLICAVLVAIPLFLSELIVGQHVRLSTIRCYTAIWPRWKALGYASACMLAVALCYYAQVVAYSLLYIVASCESPLPWVENGAEAYWQNNILNSFAEGEEKVGLGGVESQLVAALFAFWIIVLLSASFGTAVLSKITYVTVFMPVILMLILVIRTPFLEGAGDGIQFYIGKFEASKLADLSVWATACSQILFSLSPGFGTAITYSSYTGKKEDVYRICMFTVITNCLFSVIGGFAIFSILGHVAFKTGESVEAVASSSGTGLAFIVIAEAMQYFGSLANVMSVLFFVMILTLGLDSAYAWLETIVSYVSDFIDERGWKKRPKWQLTIVVALVQFLFGIMFATRRGSELVDIVDFYVATLFLLIVCCLESIMLNLDFGWERLRLALRVATIGNAGSPDGREVMPKWLCMIDFRLMVPAVTGFLAIYNLQKFIREPYGGYSPGILAIGWTFLGVLIAISLLTIWKTEHGTLMPIEELREKVKREYARDITVDTEMGTGKETSETAARPAESSGSEE